MEIINSPFSFLFVFLLFVSLFVFFCLGLDRKLIWWLSVKRHDCIGILPVYHLAIYLVRSLLRRSFAIEHLLLVSFLLLAILFLLILSQVNAILRSIVHVSHVSRSVVMDHDWGFLWNITLIAI